MSLEKSCRDEAFESLDKVSVVSLCYLGYTELAPCHCNPAVVGPRVSSPSQSCSSAREPHEGGCGQEPESQTTISSTDITATHHYL